jgi:putative transposase
MNSVFKALGYSKQSFHQKLDRYMAFEDQNENLKLIIDQIRKEHPTMAARTMYHMIQPSNMGRDMFEQFCQENGYGVSRPVNFMRTTNSSGVIRFDNLICGIVVTGVNQVWVSDITFYRINERFYFLSFIMDLFSRKIKGYSISDNMRTSHTTIPALKMIKGDYPGCIFHSDGGGQYYCKEFIKITQQMGLANSMGYSVFENPHAERVNGIIKNNYIIHFGPQNLEELKVQTSRGVRNYNNRPHGNLKKNTPNQIEEMDPERYPIIKIKVSDFRVKNPFDYMQIKEGL